MIKLGIIGLPQSGKTTIFNALTRGHIATTASAGRIEIHSAIVDVPDTRLDRLSELFKPKKTSYAKISYVDIAGLESGSAKNGFISSLLNQLIQMDGFLLVARCFPNENIPHPSGTVDPSRDIYSIREELILNDLIIVERKLDKLTEEKNKGGIEKMLFEHQFHLFSRLSECLEENKPLNELDFSEEEEKTLAGFGLLTRKPLLVLLNLGEGQETPAMQVDIPLFAIQGKLEMEIAQLPEDEGKTFMKEYGIDELSLGKMIRLSYDLLDQQTFFTVGENEVRAWTINRGATVLEAAGSIHTDMEKGFIRAEVIPFPELYTLGGLQEAKAKGKLRLEGKEYRVKEGDIVHVRFNV